MILTYLERKGVRVKPKDDLPLCADPFLVCGFSANANTGPELDDLRLDWGAPLSGHWNQAALTLVAEALLKEIREGKHEPNVPQGLSISRAEIKDMCITSLIPTRKRFLALIPRNLEDTQAAEVRAKQQQTQSSSVGRKLKRRYGVSHPRHCMFSVCKYRLNIDFQKTNGYYYEMRPEGPFD